MKILKRKTLAALLALSLLASLLPLGAQPAQAAAPENQVIYVGGVKISSTGYWTTDSAGNVSSTSNAEQPSSGGYIHYNVETNTLTLHNATIKKALKYGNNPPNSLISGAAIGVLNQNGAAELTIQLESGNTIEDVSLGIWVYSSGTGDASLTITGDGSLKASGSSSGILVQSNSGDVTLTIQNADVTAENSSSYGDGVTVRAGSSSSASLSVNGGSLTASGSPGILYESSGSGIVPNTTALTISNNAIVRASGGIASGLDGYEPVATSGKGIVFDNGTGTVYGSVTLQDDLTIGEGESLKLDDGASLNAGDYNVIVDGGTVDGELKSSVIDRNALTFPTESLEMEYVADQIAYYMASGEITLDENIALNGDGKLVIYGSYEEGNPGFMLTREDGSEQAAVKIGIESNYIKKLNQTQALAVFDKDTTDKTRALNVLYEKAGLNKLLPPGTYKGKIVLYAGYTTEEVTAGTEVMNVELDKLWKYEIPVTLTLPTLITEQPQDENVIADEDATFSVKASGKGSLEYQWQRSIDAGKNWTNISGATSSAYTIEDTTTNMNGQQYRCVVCSKIDGVVETSEAAMLTVAAASYSLSVDPSTLNFGSITEGEERPAAQTVTVKNTGNQSVTLVQPTAENFEIGALSAKELAPNATASFTIQPKDKLPRGSYSEQIVVSNTNDEKVIITATFTVKEPPYTGKYSYEIVSDVGDNGSLTVDRYATEGEKVTITVTPDDAYLLDDLSVTAGGKEVTLTAGGDGTFSFTMPSADVKISATFAEDPDWTEPEEPVTDVSDIFLDVAPNAWYKDAVQYAYDNGLMTGVSANEFAPEATTTRAMIVSMLARLEGVESAESAGFADVAANDWYATAVNWAAASGITSGTGDGNFSPNTAITREQLAAILMNYAAYKGEDVSNRADLTSYTDQPSTWAEEAMSWAVAEGLMNGVTADTLQPQGAATRAQVAAILQRFLCK